MSLIDASQTVSSGPRFDARHYRLPPAAVAKLQAMQDAGEEARAVYTTATDRLRRANETANQWRREVTTLRRQKRAYVTPIGGGEPAPSAPLMQAERELAAAEAEVARHLARQGEANEASEGPRACLHQLQRWLDKQRGRALPAFTGTVGAPVQRRGETLAQAVERVRGEIAERRADLHRIASAPLTSAEAKAAIRREVEALAEAGAPDVGRVLEGQPIRWPSFRELRHLGSNGPIYGESGDPQAVDARALMAWLMKGLLLTRLEAEVDAIADDKAALSTVQRRTEDARVRAELLALERAEEALIEDAPPELRIWRRAEADPRAVLGLAETLAGHEE